MTHRWWTRALVALAVPALLVPILASTATAAPKPPAVPTLAAVTKIYPHLDGGSSTAMLERKIRMPQESCQRGTLIKGAVGRVRLYASDDESLEDLESTGQEPLINVKAEVFPTARLAGLYLRASPDLTALQCELPKGVRVETQKIRFRLGAERWGYQIRVGPTRDRLLSANLLVVRSGRKLVSVTSMAATGRAAPSIPKTIALARLALKTAR